MNSVANPSTSSATPPITAAPAGPRKNQRYLKVNYRRRQRPKDSKDKQNAEKEMKTEASNETPKTTPKRSPKQQRSPKAEREDPSKQIFRMVQEQVRQNLMNCPPGQELGVLHRILRPDHQQLWSKCFEVKSDLMIAFQNFYPSVRLEVFGSTVMGVAFKDSDFDFYIELAPLPPNLKPSTLIGRAMSILNRSKNFAKFSPISRARVPILKCYHIRTGYSCDINFSDSYGILNSPRVAHLLNFDLRIRELALILKYFMKVHDCSGKNRISNYAILWMLIFYLQQIDPPIVPPIEDFQKNILPFYVNNYNFSFSLQLPNATTNQRRCSELLLGFFKFYATFDFHSLVICPLFGKTFKKSDIVAKKVPELQRYEEVLTLNNCKPMQLNKCISIQDPFEITHSIPGVIAVAEFKRIVYKFKYAAEIIENELSTNGESTNLLLALFDPKTFNEFAKTEEQKDIREARLKHQQQKREAAAANNVQAAIINSQSNHIVIKPQDYHLSIVRGILLKKANTSESEIDNQAVKQCWAEIVIQFIVDMLKEIFMFDVEESRQVPVATDSSSESTENGSSDVDKELSDRFLKVFVVSGTRDLFIGRKQRKKITAGSWRAEAMDSKNRFKFQQSEKFKIHLHVNTKIITDLDNFNHVIIAFHNVSETKRNFFKGFLSIVNQNINNLLRIYFSHKAAEMKASNGVSNIKIESNFTKDGEPPEIPPQQTIESKTESKLETEETSQVGETGTNITICYDTSEEKPFTDEVKHQAESMEH